MARRIVRNRCVLLLGKSGAGKSTVANHLVGHDPLSRDKPPFKLSDLVYASVTYEVEQQEVEFLWENNLYRVTIVDTPGLLHTHYTTNSFVLDKIEKYIKVHIKRIDLILFVYMKGRFNSDEREVFTLLFSLIRKTLRTEVSTVSALVVTGCDLGSGTQEEFVRYFSHDPCTKDIASQMRMGIYPVRFPDVKNFSCPALQQAYIPQIVQDRDTLRGLIAQTRPRSTDVKLTMANLTSLKTADGDNLQIIEAIAPDWKTVGYLMDFDPNGQKVDVIEAQYAHKRNGVITCCQEIFKLWLRSKDATWVKLNEILNGSGHKVLAEQVMDAVGLL